METELVVGSSDRRDVMPEEASAIASLNHTRNQVSIWSLDLNVTVVVGTAPTSVVYGAGVAVAQVVHVERVEGEYPLPDHPLHVGRNLHIRRNVLVICSALQADLTSRLRPCRGVWARIPCRQEWSPGFYRTVIILGAECTDEFDFHEVPLCGHLPRNMHNRLVRQVAESAAGTCAIGLDCDAVTVVDTGRSAAVVCYMVAFTSRVTTISRARVTIIAVPAI